MSTVRCTLRSATICALGLALGACQPSLRPLESPTPAQRPSASTADRPPLTDGEIQKLASPAVLMRTATDVFGDSTHFDGIVDGELEEEPTWDIDVRSYETHERVEHYIRAFTTAGARERMSERIQRGTRYEPMIRGKLRANDMPEDLYYLALIESGYDPNAYSSAAAVGMWQFMTATGREVGLHIDWWMDERRDPALATDAAILFLGRLQKQFGSLFLAAAAYNGGPGRVSRGLTRFANAIGDAEGDDRFFALAEQDYLYSETKNYVPQLIAAALVAKTPEKFGLDVEQQRPFLYDSLLIEAGSSLGAVARAAGVPLDTIVELNPALVRGAAPPNRAVWARIPIGLDSATSVNYGLLPAESRAAWESVTPDKGESVSALAKRYKVEVKEIDWFNPDLRRGRGDVISSGQTVRIPTRETLLAARAVPDPVIDRSVSSAAGVHVVKSGESLSVIGQRYGVSVSRLKSLNGLRNDKIRIGQRLAVQSGASVSSSASAGKTTTHLVRRGESLSVIAERYGVSVARIKSLNKLRSDRIKVGQKLVVRQS